MGRWCLPGGVFADLVEPGETPVQDVVGERAGSRFCARGTPGIPIIEAIDLEVVIGRVEPTPAPHPQVVPPLPLESPRLDRDHCPLDALQATVNDSVDRVVAALSPGVSGAAELVVAERGVGTAEGADCQRGSNQSPVMETCGDLLVGKSQRLEVGDDVEPALADPRCIFNESFASRIIQA